MIMIMVARRWATVAVVGRLSDFVRFGKLLMPSGDGRPATARRRWRSVVAGTVMDAVLASGVCAAGAQPAFCADGPAFAFRPLLAGRASLTERCACAVSRSVSWGERVKFFPKKLKFPKDAVKVALGAL